MMWVSGKERGVLEQCPDGLRVGVARHVDQVVNVGTEAGDLLGREEGLEFRHEAQQVNEFLLMVAVVFDRFGPQFCDGEVGRDPGGQRNFPEEAGTLGDDAPRL